MGAGEPCGHEVQIVGVHEDIVEIPVQGVCQVLDQSFRESTDWPTSAIEDFGTMLDNLPESNFIWANGVNRIAAPRLDIADYQISHILSMDELKIVIPVSRHREKRKALDKIANIVYQNAFFRSPPKNCTWLHDSPLQPRSLQMLLHSCFFSDVRER